MMLAHECNSWEELIANAVVSENPNREPPGTVVDMGAYFRVVLTTPGIAPLTKLVCARIYARDVGLTEDLVDLEDTTEYQLRTYRRWQDLGYQVSRGEISIRRDLNGNPLFNAQQVFHKPKS